MTATLISLITISVGILGANLFGFRYKNLSMGFTGNTITGVFGSIFVIKILGRNFLNIWEIARPGMFNWSYFILLLFVSFISGLLSVFLVSMIRKKIASK